MSASSAWTDYSLNNCENAISWVAMIINSKQKSYMPFHHYIVQAA